MDGWRDGWKAGWRDGWMDGWWTINLFNGDHNSRKSFVDTGVTYTLIRAEGQLAVGGAFPVTQQARATADLFSPGEEP